MSNTSTSPSSPSAMDIIGLEETLEIFRNLTPTTCAKMAAVAVENECKIAGKLFLSPEHASLIEQHQTIELLTENCPERAQQLKELAIEKYIVNKRTNNESIGIPSRVLNFSQSTNVDDMKHPAIVTQGIANKKQYDATYDEIVPKKKRRRKNIKWEKIVFKDFNTLTQCKIHIRELCPSLRMKETKSIDKNSVKIYQCFENGRIKKSKRGTCYARLTATTSDADIDVRLQVSMDPSCSCRNEGNLKQPPGLPQSIKDEVQKLIENVEGIQPNQIKKVILKGIVNVDLDVHNSVKLGLVETSTVHRRKIVKQIQNMSTHEKRRCKKNGTLPTYVHYVQDLINLRSQFTFRPPRTLPPVKYDTEDRLQNYGELLYKLGSLQVVKTKDVKQTNRNAFRLMTFLDPQQNTDDIHTTSPEINLYQAIEKWRLETHATE